MLPMEHAPAPGKTPGQRLGYLAAAGALIAGLLALSRANFLLFHCLAEFFSTAVAWALFLIVWNTRQLLRGHAILILGSAYLYVGLLDLLHTLSYQGRGVFSDIQASNTATQLWIAARALEAGALLLVSLMIRRHCSLPRFLLLFTVITVVILCAVRAGLMPDCYIEGNGLTTFKIAAEYTICVLLVLASLALHRERQHLDPTIYRCMAAAIAITVAAEIAFTAYRDIYGLTNTLGHILKVCSFYLVYRALIHTGLTRPFSLLLQEQNAARQRNTLVLETAIDGFWLLDGNGRIIDMNKAAAAMLGYRKAELRGLPVHAIDALEDAAVVRRKTDQLKQQGSLRFETRHRHKDGSLIDVEVSCGYLPDESGHIVAFIRDISERRRNEDRLKLQALVLDQIQDRVTITDLEGVITYVNQAETNLLGYRRDELVGKPTTVYGDNPHKGARQQDIVDATLAEGAWRGEVINYTTAGREVVMDCRTTLVRDDAGTPVALCGIATDITERKRAEEEHQFNKLRLEALLRLNEMQDADLEALAAFALEESVRLTRSEIGFINFLSDDETFVTRAVYTRHTRAICPLATGVPAFRISGCGLWSEAYRQRAPIIINDYHQPHPGKAGLPDGHLALRRFISIPVFMGDRIVAIAALANKATEYEPSDISQIRLFMEGLWQIMQRKNIEQQRARLEAAIGQANDIIVITDPDARIVYVNPAFERTTGYRSDDVAGQTPALLKSGAHDTRFYARLWETISSGAVWQGEFINRKKDGSTYHEQAAISPVKDHEGLITHYVAVKRDITADIQLREQVEQSQKMEAIGTLAGGIAHDFNNILSGIVGFIEISRDNIADGLPVTDELTDIMQLAQRAKELTRQILTFSRKSSADIRPLRIPPILEECLKMLRATLPATIEIQQKIAADCGGVLAHPVQMQQLIMNLCTNAADEMRACGGVMTVTLTETSVKEEMHSYDFTISPGSYLSLSVGDTGAGIRPEHIKRIFDPFFTTKEPEQGTGMGLSVVHGIVRNHGGAVTVDSAPGRGTVFTVLLPLVETTPATNQDIPTETPRLPGGSERILFVDDEEMIVRAGQRLLARMGYTVTAVHTPAEALALVKNNPRAYDLVITDQTMPKMTGFQLAEEVMRLRPDMPVILCTGHSETVTPHDATHAGIRAFLMKPLQKAQLAEKIRQVLDT